MCVLRSFFYADTWQMEGDLDIEAEGWSTFFSSVPTG